MVLVGIATREQLLAVFTVVPTSAQLKIGPWVKVAITILFLRPARNGV